MRNYTICASNFGQRENCTYSGRKIVGKPFQNAINRNIVTLNATREILKISLLHFFIVFKPIGGVDILRKYKKITYSDRRRIEKMYKNGVDVAMIALDIGVARQTIYREIKRGQDENGDYNADVAQLRYGDSNI